jgi:deaminated glutathione amidase
MRVSVMQMSPGHDKLANIAQAEMLIKSGSIGDILCMPEMWSCLGGNRSIKFEQAEVLPTIGSGTTGGAAYEFMRDLARRHGIFVHGGSIAERALCNNIDRLLNTTVVFGPDGNEISRYQKIHLFDAATQSGVCYRESEIYSCGNSVVTYEAAEKIIGCTICYDIRFPELYTELRRRGAEVIFVPAAFTVPTGLAHWHVLLRARAIETQCWIASAATVGEHTDAKGERRETFGHSLICDPWGRIVVEIPDGIGIATAEIDHNLTARIQKDMPIMEHRAVRQISPFPTGII